MYTELFQLVIYFYVRLHNHTDVPLMHIANFVILHLSKPTTVVFLISYGLRASDVGQIPC